MSPLFSVTFIKQRKAPTVENERISAASKDWRNRFQRFTVPYGAESRVIGGLHSSTACMQNRAIPHPTIDARQQNSIIQIILLIAEIFFVVSDRFN
jgi:hypothetical protein